MSTRTARAPFAPANPIPARQRSSSSSRLDATIDRARRHLLGQQKPDGHWCGELEGDTILESEYILLMAFLGREDDPNVVKAARYILTQQRPDGAWSNYPGGPVDLSVSVKAYFALKIAGYSIDHPDLALARELIRQAGGPVGCNSFSKFFLALLGQFPYDNCASVPPEMMFLPRWSYINIYAFSSWTRTIVVPLTIFSAHKPVRTLPESMGIRELFLDDPMTRRWPCPPSGRWFSWTNFFLGVDQVVKFWERHGPRWIRKKAIEQADAWMQEHFDDSDGVGAIFPPIVYTIICLKCLGYDEEHPKFRWAMKQLEDLFLEEDDTLRVQPCFSPVWDTALSLNALAMSNNGDAQDAMVDAARWLVDREVRRPGDWSLMNPELPSGGWFFEYRNGFYPDTDDTAMVLMGLARSGCAWDRTGLDESDLPATFRLGGPHAPNGTLLPAHAAASTGCSACRTPTAAGRRSTATSTTRSSRRSRSPTTRRCSTRVAPTSPPACWKRSASSATGPATRTSTAPSPS